MSKDRYRSIFSQRNEGYCVYYPSVLAPGAICNRRGCSSEILTLTTKGDHLGVAHAFCDP